MRKKARRGLMIPASIGLLAAGRRFFRQVRADDLRGEVVLITGGSRGLGFLLAREFGREGCRVAINARDEVELEEARQQLAQEGIEVFTVRCDVSDPAQVAFMIDQTTERYGRIDILVNNAAIIQVGPLEAITLQDFRATVDIILWGMVYSTLGVLSQMLRRNKGRIVNITSIGGKIAVPHLMPYSVAKFATVGFSEGLRAELAGKNVTVTTIVPGLMRTGSPFNAAFKSNQEHEFTWFGLGDSLPLLSIDAERASREIVLATKRGDAERILTLPANVITRFHGLFPGLTADLFGLANRVILPDAEGLKKTEARGAEIYDRITSSLVKRLMDASLSAAQRFNQFAATPPPAEVIADEQAGPASEPAASGESA